MAPEIVPAAIFFTMVSSFAAGMVGHRWLLKLINRETNESAIRASALREEAAKWRRQYEDAMGELHESRKTLERLQEMVAKVNGRGN